MLAITPNFISAFFQEVYLVLVSIQPTIGVCTGFVDSRGRRLYRSIVLAPIRIRVESGDYTLSWMCNLAEKRRNREALKMLDDVRSRDFRRNRGR